MSAPRRAVAVAALLAGCGCAPPVPETGVSAPEVARVEPVLAHHPRPSVPGALRIGAIFPAVGRYAGSGLQSLNGARLAAADVNAAGGIHGRPLELLEYRTGSYFLDAARAAGLAAAEGRVLGVVGSNSSSLSMAVAEVVEAHGLVQISNVSTSHDLTWDPVTGRERQFVFRVCGSDERMGRLLARFARGDLGARRVAVLYEVGRTYSAQLAQSFIEAFADPEAGRVTAEFLYLSLEIDFRKQLRDVAQFRPDVVFVPGSFTDATLVTMQAEQLGLHPIFLGADGWSNRLLFSRGGPTRPAYFGDLCAPPPEFQERYAARFGEVADGCRAVLAYDAVRALAAALEQLGPLDDAALGADLRRTRAQVRDAVAALDLAGAAGPVRFDAHGDSQRGVAVVEVKPAAAGGYTTSLRGLLGGA